ncbi:MAG: hypothetical protein IPI35_17760 [Deltaproteobacteria bacterium]|nr:hypothetical protein [Deltaproteobacteria bacterium]
MSKNDLIELSFIFTGECGDLAAQAEALSIDAHRLYEQGLTLSFDALYGDPDPRAVMAQHAVVLGDAERCARSVVHVERALQALTVVFSTNAPVEPPRALNQPVAMFAALVKAGAAVATAVGRGPTRIERVARAAAALTLDLARFAKLRPLTDADLAPLDELLFLLNKQHAAIGLALPTLEAARRALTAPSPEAVSPDTASPDTDPPDEPAPAAQSLPPADATQADADLREVK